MTLTSPACGWFVPSRWVGLCLGVWTPFATISHCYQATLCYGTSRISTCYLLLHGPSPAVVTDWTSALRLFTPMTCFCHQVSVANAPAALPTRYITPHAWPTFYLLPVPFHYVPANTFTPDFPMTFRSAFHSLYGSFLTANLAHLLVSQLNFTTRSPLTHLLLVCWNFVYSPHFTTLYRHHCYLPHPPSHRWDCRGLPFPFAIHIWFGYWFHSATTPHATTPYLVTVPICFVPSPALCSLLCRRHTLPTACGLLPLPGPHNVWLLRARPFALARFVRCCQHAPGSPDVPASHCLRCPYRLAAPPPTLPTRAPCRRTLAARPTHCPSGLLPPQLPQFSAGFCWRVPAYRRWHRRCPCLPPCPHLHLGGLFPRHDCAFPVTCRYCLHTFCTYRQPGPLP